MSSVGVVTCPLSSLASFLLRDKARWLPRMAVTAPLPSPFLLTSGNGMRRKSQHGRHDLGIDFLWLTSSWACRPCEKGFPQAHVLQQLLSSLFFFKKMFNVIRTSSYCKFQGLTTEPLLLITDRIKHKTNQKTKIKKSLCVFRRTA